MRLRILGLLSVLLAQCGYPQSSIENTLKRLNKGSVPYVQPTDLHKDSTAILLDTRKKEEFNVSALPGAHWVGYSSFELEEVDKEMARSRYAYRGLLLRWCSL